MKSTVLILLLCIYSLSVFGVSSKQFYCCGELRSVSLALGHEGEAANDDKNDGCCETKTQSFKVKDKHLQMAETVFSPKAILIPAPEFFLTYQPAFIDQKPGKINGSHAPPIYSGVAIYISHRVFRI
ncbi:MAG TPA: hypothetical protein VM935_12245 [Chitinophagaceae bacterium]|nr:hypothetical protein [Chitinophagaceae bacterium]